MKDTRFGYAVFIITMVVAANLLFSGCSSPAPNTWINPHNNMLTPDRLGVGISRGSMNAYGVSNKFLPNQREHMEMDWDGDMHTASIWLEWDIPTWNESNYDRYLRDRVRSLNIELEMANEAAQINKE